MRLVVSGTRSTSITSMVTVQPSSSRCMPSTPVTFRPSISCISSPAWRASWRNPLRRGRPPSSSAILLELPLLAPARVHDGEALHQALLLVGALLVGQLAALGAHVELGELAADAALVVELAVGLLRDLLADPGHALHGRERQREQTRDQAHAGT